MDEKEINNLVKDKAEELIKKQKEQELYSALFKMAQSLPRSLAECQSVMEMLVKEIESAGNENKEHLQEIYKQYEKLNKDLNNLYSKIKQLQEEDNQQIEKLNWNIVDRNNPNSFILQIEKMFGESERKLTDLNNEASLTNVIKSSFQEVLDGLQRNRNIRDIITWVLTSALTITMIIRWVLEFTNK
jgi:DNA repair exonuclease SbcCD ATPase subunit